MAISSVVELVTTALWPQGDIRDPLGVWGARLGVTGDGSDGIKVAMRASAGVNAAYIYTCYSAIAVQLTGTPSAFAIKCRLLTNWPNVDVAVAGVQGYGSARGGIMRQSSAFTAPNAVPDLTLVAPNERFLLLFDPRPSRGDLDIVEIEIGTNVTAATYSFEAYGYYWDRSVTNAPGGPRHPGSS